MVDEVERTEPSRASCGPRTGAIRHAAALTPGGIAGDRAVPSGWRVRLARLFLDRLALQIDSYTAYRHAITQRLVAAGPVRTLNIGTGGGLESLRLLAKGNHVTAVTIDPAEAERTRQRAVRNGFGSRLRCVTGHVLDVDLPERFHQVYMCEVLEHIEQDFAVLHRIADWLLPGGRLVLSTPTAAYGQLPGETLSPSENGDHVRVGYEGPELDEMLAAVGLRTVARIRNFGRLTQAHHRLERALRNRSLTRALGFAYSLASRPLVPVLELVRAQPADQITLAVKRGDPLSRSPAGG